MAAYEVRESCCCGSNLEILVNQDNAYSRSVIRDQVKEWRDKHHCPIIMRSAIQEVRTNND